MVKRIHTLVAALGGLALVPLFHITAPAVRAQSGRSVLDGVYTEAQAKRGEKVYADTCAVCHGADLKGSEFIPSLIGPTFMANWKDKTTGELFEKIKATMPAVAPGTLTAEQSADSVAYILSVAKYPAGASELPAKAEELAQIRIDAPTP